MFFCENDSTKIQTAVNPTSKISLDETCFYCFLKQFDLYIYLSPPPKKKLNKKKTKSETMSWWLLWLRLALGFGEKIILYKTQVVCVGVLQKHRGVIVQVVLSQAQWQTSQLTHGSGMICTSVNRHFLGEYLKTIEVCVQTQLNLSIHLTPVYYIYVMIYSLHRLIYRVHNSILPWYFLGKKNQLIISPFFIKDLFWCVFMVLESSWY